MLNLQGLTRDQPSVNQSQRVVMTQSLRSVNDF